MNSELDNDQLIAPPHYLEVLAVHTWNGIVLSHLKQYQYSLHNNGKEKE